MLAIENKSISLVSRISRKQLLSWVAAEIASSLASGRQSLSAYRDSQADAPRLRYARNEIHQAACAINILGLEAAAVYTKEIDYQLSRLEELDSAGIDVTCPIICRACRKLEIFLDELVRGLAPIPLKLFPEYEAMQLVRGVQAVSPSDLFFPNLNLRAPRINAASSFVADKLRSHLRKQLRLYQRGLSEFLRHHGNGAQGMCDAVAKIMRASEPKSTRAFWWTVCAFLDALVRGGLEPNLGAKQLATRLGLHIRRTVEGSVKVSDSLWREVLYYVAISKPVTPRLSAVQHAFALPDLIPSTKIPDLVSLQPVLKDSRALLGVARDLWLKLTSGRVDALPGLKRSLKAVERHTAELGNSPLRKLAGSLAAQLNKLPPSCRVSEALAMEYASGIQLADSALENFGNLSPRFPKQVNKILARIDAAQASRPLRPAKASDLDEMSWQALERLLLKQVAHEIRANLSEMEKVLDVFFRDNQKRGDLVTLDRFCKEIRGALRILDEADAECLLGICQEQINSYISPDTLVNVEDLDLLAELMTGLEIYVDALSEQIPDRRRLIGRLLARGLEHIPAGTTDQRAEAVKRAIGQPRNFLSALMAEVPPAPTENAASSMLNEQFIEVDDDVQLTDYAGLIDQAQTTVVAITAGADAGRESAVSAQKHRLNADHECVGATEIMDLYLDQAIEVLNSITQIQQLLEANPDDREALRRVQRAFHSLKTSSRIVGLSELGEIAWHVERVHNRLLEEGLAANPAVRSMIVTAEHAFHRCIASLRDTGSVAPDVSEVLAAIHKIEAESPLEQVLTAQPNVNPSPLAPNTASVQDAQDFSSVDAMISRSIAEIVGGFCHDIGGELDAATVNLKDHNFAIAEDFIAAATAGLSHLHHFVRQFYRSAVPQLATSISGRDVSRFLGQLCREATRSRKMRFRYSVKRTAYRYILPPVVLRHIVWPLVHNAIESVESMIHPTPSAVAFHVLIEGLPHERTLHIVVRDFGVGWGGRASEVQNLIKKGQSASTKGPHRGFGLPNVWRFVQRLRGNLVLSDFGPHGGAVEVELPWRWINEWEG